MFTHIFVITLAIVVICVYSRTHIFFIMLATVVISVYSRTLSSSLLRSW